MSELDRPFAPARGRPRDERARRAILHAVATLLADRGYESLTVEGIAAEAGVGKQTIYRWWQNKAAVVGEAFLEDFIGFPGVPLARTTDVWADLDEWMRAGEEGFSGHYGDIVRIAEIVASADAAIAARMRVKFADPPRELLLSRLRTAVADGQINEQIDLDAVVDLLQAVISHAGLTRSNGDAISNALTIIRRAAQR